MIISRTPLRVSLFGGGTDFSDFFTQEEGTVVSMGINKYMYITVNHKFNGKFNLRYSKKEECECSNDLKHDIVRECIKLVGIKEGVEIVIVSDVPSIGTGLGTSGALTVGVLNALYKFSGSSMTQEKLAELACHIEIDILRAPIGKQDQYACAMGGFHQYVFKKNGEVWILDDMSNNVKHLIDNLYLFYVPNGRKSSRVLSKYRNNISKNMECLLTHIELVNEFLEKYTHISAKELGNMLTRAWEIKKSTSPASNELVEKAIDTALNSSHGAKNCGAGRGGFILVSSNCGEKLISDMAENGFQYLPFKLDYEGTKIIYEG